MAFVKPFVMIIEELPILCYVEAGVREASHSVTTQYSDLLRERVLFAVSQCADGTEYGIAFFWEHEGHEMLDLWSFAQSDDWGSGPLAYVVVFDDGAPISGIGVASGNTLIVLGAEELQRRQSSSLSSYLDGPRPTLPESLCEG